MADIATIGEIAYLAWWREYDPDGRYRHDAWADLPHRHRNAWQAAAEAAAAEVAARKAAMAGHGQPATGDI